MRDRNREVEDDLDVIPRQQLVNRAGARHPKGGGLGCGSRQIEVGHETLIDIGKAGQVLEVLARDDPGADQADARAAAHSASATSFEPSQASDCAMPSNTSPE